MLHPVHAASTALVPAPRPALHPGQAPRAGWVPPAMRPEWLTLGVVVFVLLAGNQPFWHQVWQQGGSLTDQLRTSSALFLCLLAGFNLLLTPLALPWLLRPVLSALLLLTAVTSYFMNQYGVMIDVNMVRNALETDLHEALDLLTPKLGGYLVLLGILPTALLWRIPIRWRRPSREWRAKLVVVVLTTLTLIGVGASCYATLASTLRNHRELRFLLAPSNVLQASSSYLKRRWRQPSAWHAVGTDARLDPSWQHRPRPSLTVLVVGETARADHMALNGYGRDTNPLLRQQHDLISLTQVRSCGTETAISLPCMFSSLGRKQFDRELAQRQDNLLDVLQRAGLAVRWVENQAGCKQVCDRVPHHSPMEQLDANTRARLCTGGTCLDGALLEGLEQQITQLNQHTVLVLHMMGSHGPAYAQRYPARMAAFHPACATSQLDRCSDPMIVNAYDNSLRYTDAVLAQLLDMLRRHADRVDSAMLYVSDHGESLGENRLYLHAAPYLLAPDAQKHVPMLLWFSTGYQQQFALNTACLREQRHQAYSHDHWFHSVLGLLQVQTSAYQTELDLFAGCRRTAIGVTATVPSHPGSS